MKHPALVVGLVALLASPALAQPGPPPATTTSPSPEVMQLAQKVRDAARMQALAALSADHQAKVNAVLGGVKSRQITDLRDAAKQIDAILNPKESQAILAARDKMNADIRAAFGAPDGGPPPGGPPPGGGPPGDGPPAGGGAPPGGGFGGPPGGGGGFGGPPGGGGGFGPPSGRDGMRAMRSDAGVALLTLSLDRDTFRSLMGNHRPPQ